MTFNFINGEIAMLRYVSTRGNAEPLSFKDTLIAGLASDGGLYVPSYYPVLDVASLRGLGYQDVAIAVLRLFMNDIPLETLDRIVRKTYTKTVFGSDEITPLSWLDRGKIAVLQLSNGPTLAFKDVALQLLGNLLEYVLEERNEELNIVSATSGDTGSAAEYALMGRSRVRVFMLSPAGRMSLFQRQQMYTLDHPNIFNLVVDGTFDDCQAMVKELNRDAAFKEQLKIGAVNSINWARIAAQVVYYVYGYLQASEDESTTVTFADPSGNFGNALAAHITRQMGLNIKIIVATNTNDVLDEFFRTGVYRIRKGDDVAITNSPSMDIASASNFERFIYDYVEFDAQYVARLWKRLEASGEFNILNTNPGEHFGITSGSATDEEVLATIRDVSERFSWVLDPHTAVAAKVGLEKWKSSDGPLVIVETAQPVKFADTMQKALGRPFKIPGQFAHLSTLPDRSIPLRKNVAILKAFVANHSS